MIDLSYLSFGDALAWVRETLIPSFAWGGFEFEVMDHGLTLDGDVISSIIEIRERTEKGSSLDTPQT